MYDVISDIINHNWDNQLYGSEQQYIYYICSVIIVIFFVISIDLLYRLIRSILGRRS